MSQHLIIWLKHVYTYVCIPCILAPIVLWGSRASHTFHIDPHVQNHNYNQLLDNYPPQADQTGIFYMYRNKAAERNNQWTSHTHYIFPNQKEGRKENMLWN